MWRCGLLKQIRTLACIVTQYNKHMIIQYSPTPVAQTARRIAYKSLQNQGKMAILEIWITTHNAIPNAIFSNYNVRFEDFNLYNLYQSVQFGSTRRKHWIVSPPVVSSMLNVTPREGNWHRCVAVLYTGDWPARTVCLTQRRRQLIFWGYADFFYKTCITHTQWRI